MFEKVLKFVDIIETDDVETNEVLNHILNVLCMGFENMRTFTFINHLPKFPQMVKLTLKVLCIVGNKLLWVD